jgi:hypothetical protein
MQQHMSCIVCRLYSGDGDDGSKVPYAPVAACVLGWVGGSHSCYGRRRWEQPVAGEQRNARRTPSPAAERA